MARKTLFLFTVSLLLSWSSLCFASYSIDGYLSDWGINPFSDWTPWDSRVDFVEEDWTQPPPYASYIGHGVYPGGGEPCDMEALYFDDDPNYLYLALVTSYPFVSGCGDIALGFSDYQYAIKLRGLDTYGHMYVPLKKLRPGEDWTYSVAPFFPDPGPVYLAGGLGEDIGLAEIYYWDATQGGGPYTEPNSPDRNTWVMEAKLNRLLFDGLTPEGGSMLINHTMDCGNDYLRLCADFDSPPVPEPMSLLLLGSGLLGLVGLRKRR